MKAALAALEPELRATFGDAAMARLEELAGPLPTLSVFGFECRLARPGSDVDMSVYVPRSSLEWPLSLRTDPRWARILTIADTRRIAHWAPSVLGAWFELDAGDEASPIPSVFLHVEGPRPTPAILLLLAKRLGVVELPDVGTLARCLAALPETPSVHLQIGAMIPRGARNARVVLHDVSPSSFLALAKDLGWRDEAGTLARVVERMATLFDRISIALELGAHVGERIAVEGEILDHRSPRWRDVMDWLVAEGLADAPWAERLTRWPAIQPWETRPAGWPPCAIRGATAPGAPAARAVRRISHAKVALGSKGEREAKLYLLAEHRVLGELWPSPLRAGLSRAPQRTSRNP